MRWAAKPCWVVLLVAVTAMNGCGKSKKAATRLQALDQALVDVKSPDAKVRREAAALMASYQDPRVVDALLGLLKDSEKDARLSAISGLQVQRSPKAVEPLIELLKDGDTEIRSAAAGALGAQADPRGIQPLTDLSQNDPDEVVRDRAKEALDGLNYLLKEQR